MFFCSCLAQDKARNKVLCQKPLPSAGAAVESIYYRTILDLFNQKWIKKMSTAASGIIGGDVLSKEKWVCELTVACSVGLTLGGVPPYVTAPICIAAIIGAGVFFHPTVQKANSFLDAGTASLIMGGGCSALLAARWFHSGVENCISSDIPKICRGFYLVVTGVAAIAGAFLICYGVYYLYKSVQPSPKKSWYQW